MMVVGDGSSEEEAVEVVFPRSNGWTCPWHPLQCLAWFLLVLLALMHYGFLAHYIPGLYRIPIFLLPSGVVAVLVLSMIVATSINPAEDNFRRKLTSIMIRGPISRPKFNRSRHTHVIEDNYCNLCQVHVSASAKHCRLCDKCVTNFDHHCKWLNNCVGSRNYKWFLASVWSALLGLFLLFIFSNCLFVLFFADRESLRFNCNSLSNLTACARSLRVLGGVVPDPVFPTLCVVISLMCLLGIILLGHLVFFHIYIKVRGQTTYEYFNQVKKEKPVEVEPDLHSQRGRGWCFCLRRRRRRKTKTNRVSPETVSLVQSTSLGIGVKSIPSQMAEINTALADLGMGHEEDLFNGRSSRSSMISSSLDSAGMATFGRTPSPENQSSHTPAMPTQVTGSSPLPVNPLPVAQKEEEEKHRTCVEWSERKREEELSMSSISALAKEEVELPKKDVVLPKEEVKLAKKAAELAKKAAELAKEEVELTKNQDSSPTSLDTAVANNSISNTVLSHLALPYHHQLWREATTSSSTKEPFLSPMVLGEPMSRASELPPIVSPLESTPVPNNYSDGTLNLSVQVFQKLSFQHLDEHGSSDELFLPDSRSNCRPLPPISSMISKKHFSSKGYHLPPLPFQSPRPSHDALSLYSTSSYSQLLSHSGSSASLPLLHNPRHSSTYLTSYASGTTPLKWGKRSTVLGPPGGGDKQKKGEMNIREGKKTGVGGAIQTHSLPSITSAAYVEPIVVLEEDMCCSPSPLLTPSIATPEEAPV